MVCEYLALTRLVHAMSPWRMRPITVLIGATVALITPFSLIDPQDFYDALIRPSLIALWLSQLIVFAVYPLFARKHGQRLLGAALLSLAASALAIYGLWTAIQQATS